MADWLSLRALRVSGSGVPTTVMIMTAVLFLSDLTTAKPLCKPGWYYDTVTGNCDHCSDICDHAKAMETIKECERKCQVYRTENNPQKEKCPAQQYFDATVERCHSCDTVCRHAQIKGTQDDCLILCPDWSGLTQESTPITQTDTVTRQQLADGTIVQTPLLDVDVTNILMAVSALLASLLVGFLVVASILSCLKRGNKLINNTCNKRPQQPQQLESHELESLTGRGEPVSHPQDDEG